MAFTPVAIKDGTNTSQNMGAYQDAGSNNYPITSKDVNIATYMGGVSRITAVATPTVVFEMAFTLSKCSAAGTLGSATRTAITSIPLDSGSAAASSTPQYIQSANYTTVPTVVGVIYAGELEMGALATGVCRPHDIVFGDGYQSLVLRGTAQKVTVEFLGTAIPSGGVHSATFVWTEDAS